MTTNNHPAHGPVSLDRLHQISEILSKAAAQSDGGNLGYAMADAVKVIDGEIAKFEEQDNPRPVMAVKGELGFIDNLEKIIEERDEDIDIGQLGSSNYDALMLAALDAFRTSIPEPVVPEPKSYMDFLEQYPDMTVQDSIERSAGWTSCRAAMLQAGNSPETPDGWIPVSERTPEESGRYWCYVEEQNSLGKSHYQWNCSWNGEVWSDKALTGRVTHWMPLPAAPQQEGV